MEAREQRIENVKSTLNEQEQIGADIALVMLDSVANEPAQVNTSKGSIDIQRVRLSGAFQSAKVPCVDVSSILAKAGITGEDFAKALKAMQDNGLLAFCSESWQQQQPSLADIRGNVERKRKNLYFTYPAAPKLKRGSGGDNSYKSAQDSRAEGFISLVFGD